MGAGGGGGTEKYRRQEPLRKSRNLAQAQDVYKNSHPIHFVFARNY